MPIFMDRHDLKGVTAAEVAEAHKKDLAIQGRYGVRYMTYWFDEARGTTFCLVDAPDKAAAECVHREAHGHIAGEVLEVPLAAVEAFLGRITDFHETATGKVQTQIDSGRRAILFTDIVGSTEMTARLGDRMATELIRAHDSIVRRCLAAFDGREVKHTGDGIMAVFPDSRRGVDCAIRIRIDLDSGEPVEDSNDLFGTTVQLAARLWAEAQKDQILVSATVARKHGDAAVFKAAEQRPVKGFAGTVGVVECVWTKTE